MPFTPIKPIAPKTSGFTPINTPADPNTPPASQAPAPLPFKFPSTETRDQKIARYKAEADASAAESKKANSTGGFIKNAVTAPAMENLPFVGGAISVAKTLNKTIDNPSQYESQNIITLSGQNQQLLKDIRAKKAAGEDTSKLEQAFNNNVDSIGASVKSINDYNTNLPSNGQAVGQLLHTGMDILTAGTYGKMTAGMKTGVLAQPSVLPTAVKTAEELAKSKAGLFTAQGAKNVVWGALKGGGVGYVYDVANGLEGKRGNDRTGADALIPGGGTAVGSIIGGGIPAVTGAKNSIKNAIETQKEQAAQQVDDLVGSIIQGKTKDIPKAKQALSSIDTSGIKTYKDLTDALDAKIETASNGLDDILSKNPTVKPLGELNLVKDVNGKQVSHNYVQDAIDQLKELYTKVNDPIGLEQVNQIESKAATQGLTIKEMNDLAKEYGFEIGSKAFSKGGEPLTSVNAQGLENVRSGIKETARELFDDPIYGETDKQISNLMKTRDLTKDMSEKVNLLQQKIKDRSLGEKVGRLVFKIANAISGGSMKGFGESFITRGEGLKTLNALDLERRLSGNLDKIQSVLDDSSLPEKTIIDRLQSVYGSLGGDLPNKQGGFINLVANVTPEETTQASMESARSMFLPKGNTQNGIDMMDKYISSGEVPAAEIYQNVAKKIYQPDRAEWLIGDAKQSLINSGFPDIAAKLAKELDVNSLTPQKLIDTALKLIGKK